MNKPDTAKPLKPRRGRPPGRPHAQPDAADQRTRLIEIALALYAKQGYAGTTLAAIARAADMTPAAVHYYFKTREQLFDEIHEAHIVPMRKHVEAIFHEHAGDPVAAFVKVAERFVDVAGEHEWIAPVFFGDLLTEGDTFRKHVKGKVDYKTQAAFHERIQAWQATGLLNPELDPSLIMPSIMSLTMLFMAARRKWKDDPIRKEVTRATIRRHAMALLGHGLGPPKA
ncbi:TetR/AcrR family transcriptional regulator [Luteibacter aegosomatissinici]|uniref:TetR/AcrR family transcriptional regulator n=1 Tax=Luteibacter aegosomatissinici TaxID=2911539 RepID=UPI001FFC0E60|nr:TetR/AcrR family transcriptional regulator [Luteibacter aegosomatissinici]UPG96637.1 TetR/AcrR family transcriptional regulator [Luteibacter aegosomatissinici]